MAVTFDDLPALAQGDRSVATYERITEGLLRALAEHRVPAIGFVNEEKLLTEGRVDHRRVARCGGGWTRGRSWGTTHFRIPTSTPRPWTPTSPTWRAATGHAAAMQAAGGGRASSAIPSCTPAARWTTAGASKRSWRSAATVWRR